MTTTPSPPSNRSEPAHSSALDIDELTSGPTGLELFNTIRERMGWTDEYLKEINDPSHPLLQDIDTMCAALEYLRVHQMPLVVIPDFDTDGICAGMILYAGLSELGLDVRLHVPDYHLGHEIQPEVIDQVMLAFPDAKAVITCDAGTNSTEALSRANEYELLTLVTDHHVEEGRGGTARNINDSGLSNTCSIGDNWRASNAREKEKSWGKISTLRSSSACSITRFSGRSTLSGSILKACRMDSSPRLSRSATPMRRSRTARSARPRDASESGGLNRTYARRGSPFLSLDWMQEQRARVRRSNCEYRIDDCKVLPATVVVAGSTCFVENVAAELTG